MHLNIAPNGVLQIDDARIVFRNFAGAATKFNRLGDRNFAVVIEDQETYDALINEVNEHGVSWNIRVKPPREEGELPFITLAVKVKFNDRGPNIYLTSGGRTIELNEDTIGMLDNIDIARIDLDIRPYDDVVSGKPFRAAYLLSMHVTQNVTDRFASRFRNEIEDDIPPFD